MSPAIFLGETQTRLVQGRRTFKVPMLYKYTSEHPEFADYMESTRTQDNTELENMYKEFCKKAFEYLLMHESNRGDKMANRFIFPDFIYEVIPKKFPVE